MLQLINDEISTGKPREFGRGLSISEILLLNKTSGLPILSRVYGKAMGKDPVLIAGLLAAIISFAESFGDNLTLNDIGIKAGSRLFVRADNQITCVIIINNFDISQLFSPDILILINEISLRIFEVIRMLFASHFIEPLTPLEELLEVSYEEYIIETLADLDGTKMDSYPEIGYIIDNIVLESTMMFSLKDEEIEEALIAMEEEDVTYLKEEYAGTTKKIDKKAKASFKINVIRPSKVAEEEDD